MTKNSDATERFGGPGSSHQDRDHPGKNHQPTGKKGGGAQSGTGPVPGEPTNTSASRVSGGGGERDTHHTHTDRRS
ncbi:MAG: hypothetical protein U1E70_19285 [Acetobacteraceae bacterium]|nr:hypothetical protein [Pseudomonadota bacterium]